jgi:chromosome partitioning protein
MPRYIAVVNQKGGAGKTTIAVNVASALGVSDLVDADPQGTAAAWNAEGTLPVPVHSLPVQRLGAWLERVRAMRAPYVVIDAPPALEDAAEAAIGIADLVLVPCTPSGADLLPTRNAIELIRLARQHRDDGGPACLLVPNRVDVRTAAGRELAGALEALGEPVGPGLGDRTAFVDSFTAGQWVGEYEPRGKAAQELQALVHAITKGK